ncbi:MAG TPA: MFS transporter [Acidimicrobiia bacterium]|nr:MFS transporter [Acidimicrobiia bacterium]
MTASSPSAPPRHRARTVGLVALLGVAMATATYLQGALSVLSSSLIDEFGLTRSQLGVAFMAFSLTGAVASPVMGTLTDRDATSVMAALFGVTALAVVAVAAAPNFAVLVGGSVLGGLALGAGNPVTNRVIAEDIGAARRGLVVGLKQSGPPLGLLAAGLILPPLALAWGWRWAFVASAAIPLAGLMSTPFLLPRSRRSGSPPATRMSDESRETRSAVMWLTLIGLGVALSLSAVIAFLPLYAQERVGASAAGAGALAAAFGLTGVAGRIAWGALARRFARPTSPLIAITVVAVLAVVAIALAQELGMWILWVGVIGCGFTLMAWHALGWLVLIDQVGVGGVGKASAVMQIGNSIGFASGPPIAGLLVDATGSYMPAWVTMVAVLVVIGLLTVWIRIRTTSPKT